MQKLNKVKQIQNSGSRDESRACELMHHHLLRRGQVGLGSNAVSEREEFGCIGQPFGDPGYDLVSPVGADRQSPAPSFGRTHLDIDQWCLSLEAGKEFLYRPAVGSANASVGFVHNTTGLRVHLSCHLNKAQSKSSFFALWRVVLTSTSTIFRVVAALASGSAFHYRCVQHEPGSNAYEPRFLLS